MVRSGFGIAAALLVTGCVFGDETGGVSGPVISFVGTASDADETDGTVEIGIELSAPSSELVTVIVDATGTATAGEDYSSVEGIVLFPPGLTYQWLSVFVAPDSVPEPEETVEMTLVGARNGRIGSSSHYTFAIRDNLLPRLTFTEAAQYSGEHVADAVANVRVLPASPVPITVDYMLGGTAGPADYTLLPGTLTIPAGVTEYALPLGLVNDTLDEDDETIIMTLTNPANAILGEFPTLTHTIDDTDPQIAASFGTSEQVAVEGNSGSQIVTVDVVLDKVSGRTLNIPFFVDTYSTASSGTDYMIMTPSPLVFPPGVTSQTISVAILGDVVQDGSEKLTLQVGASAVSTTTYPSFHTITIDNDECYGTAAFTVCPDTAPATSLTLTGTAFTSGGMPCEPDQPPGWIESGQPTACFVVAGDITVGSFRAMGSRPLVLVAINSITVNDQLDVSSHMDVYPGGAGANPSSCLAFGAAPGTGAGGAGGSFMTMGGAGGAHGGPSAGGIPAPAVPASSILRGGCPGQYIEFDQNGHGGGAVYLIAGGSITLASGATINASGGFGAGGSISSGGPGGGSGGMIALWAPTIAATGARLLANGAGGGEGSYNFADGMDGSNPLYTSPLSPALGGAGTAGGDGGNGAVQGTSATAGASANNNAAGGGGGGGLGYIVAHQPLTGATCTPSEAAF